MELGNICSITIMPYTVPKRYNLDDMLRKIYAKFYVGSRNDDDKVARVIRGEHIPPTDQYNTKIEKHYKEQLVSNCKKYSELVAKNNDAEKKELIKTEVDKFNLVTLLLIECPFADNCINSKKEKKVLLE